MRTFVVALAIMMALTSTAFAKGKGGGSRPSYGGGHHSASHGGAYKGGSGGSSHKGGSYKNTQTGDRYGKHK